MKIFILSLVACAVAAFTSEVCDPPPLPSGTCTLKYDNPDLPPLGGFIRKLPDGHYAYCLDNGEVGLIYYCCCIKKYEAFCTDPEVKRYIWWDEEKKKWRFQRMTPTPQLTGTLEFDSDSDDA